MSEILRLAGLGQTYQSAEVLRDIALSLGAGERLAVLGPSGSGKTTLLRLIAGLEAPKRGEITLSGALVSRAGEIVIPPERREVAMVFQGLALFPHLCALEQIAFAARGRGGIEEARSLLDRVGLGHRAGARLDQLSGGERQRIALARALAQKPKLLLMDEPFASLDDDKRAEMRDLLRSLLERSETALILVTHSREDAFDLARHVLVLERGERIACGPLESMLLHPGRLAVVRALGLGQIIEGEADGSGSAITPFGKVIVPPATSAGPVRLLLRPGQPRLVPAPAGVEAEVVSFELRPSETRAARWLAVLRVGDLLLRIVVREHLPQLGDRVSVQIDSECEIVDQ